jgi:hypothetical protein
LPDAVYEVSPIQEDVGVAAQLPLKLFFEKLFFIKVGKCTVANQQRKGNWHRIGSQTSTITVALLPMVFPVFFPVMIPTPAFGIKRSLFVSIFLPLGFTACFVRIHGCEIQ